MAVFPSVAWFDEVCEIFNNDESYHGGGAGDCNCEMGIKYAKQYFKVTFEGHDCSGAKKITAKGLEPLDFYLDMEPEEWQAMLNDIKANGQASFDYTLNTLDLEKDDGLAISATGDQYRADLFMRYNQTIQNLFDASARIDTEFK